MEVQVELYYSFDTFANDVERYIFIGRVDGIAFQSESHQNGLNA